jgi:hypothetical protein
VDPLAGLFVIVAIGLLIFDWKSCRSPAPASAITPQPDQPQESSPQVTGWIHQMYCVFLRFNGASRGMNAVPIWRAHKPVGKQQRQLAKPNIDVFNRRVVQRARMSEVGSESIAPISEAGSVGEGWLMLDGSS